MMRTVVNVIRSFSMSRPVLVGALAASLVVGASAWTLVQRAIDSDGKSRFDLYARNAQQAVALRIKSFTDVLGDTGSMMQSADIGRDQFHAFVAGLHLAKRYPGLVTINFAARVRHSELKQFESTMRALQAKEGFGTRPFRVWPTSERDEHLTLTIIEGWQPNSDMYGFDFIATPGSQAIMDQIRDAGEIRIFGATNIVSAPETIVIMRLPIYRHGQPTSTVAQRREAYVGSLGIAVSIPKLMEGVIDEVPAKDVRLLLTDYGRPDVARDPEVLYDSHGKSNRSALQLASEPGRFTSIVPVLNRGTTWMLSVSAPKASVVGAAAGYFPWLASVGVAATTFLAIALLNSLMTSRRRAIQLAKKMTRQLQQSQVQLRKLAAHDPLTALPNRRLFLDRLDHALKQAARHKTQLAVLFIDLDRFKTVNDTLGHHVGDELLKQVAQTLTDRLRQGDTLARLGGDEFIVLLENIDGEAGASQVASKLVAAFERPFTVTDRELFVTCSVGVSLYPEHAVDLNMLIRNADAAMYQAKARGRNHYQLYAPSMTGEGLQRLHIETMLRRSIEKNEVFLHYQPQVEIDTGRLIGVEALLRWHNPELGLVPPARFIPLAEDTGFICQLGAWVLEQACRQMVRWQQDGLVVPKLAVNLSVRQFERGSIADTVAAVLLETGLEPARLQLEVTESVIMNSGDAVKCMNDLREIGVGLAIDDFGTGYSSLAYLKQLPVQTLKIDRSFIKDISNDANDEAITVAIIQLGKSLNLSVIAEGVETSEQAAFLLRHGCTRAQGYYYSKPASATEVLAQWGD